MRAWLKVGLIVAGIAWIADPASAQRQGRIRSPAYRDPERVTAEIDRAIVQSINDAEALIEQKKFAPAVMQLQSVLDHPEDYLNEKVFRSGLKSNLGVKAETHQKLSNLSAAGRAAYELHFGTTARTMLVEALRANDAEKLAEVVSRYETTAAGLDALQWLAATAFDHDQPIDAALLCEAIIRHPLANVDLIARLKMRSAYAWYLAQRPDRSTDVLKSLKKLNVAAAWRIGNHAVPEFQQDSDIPAWLTTHFGPPAAARVRNLHEWNLPHSGLTGNESVRSACPVGGGDWAVSTLENIRIENDEEANQKLKDLFRRLTLRLDKLLRDDRRQTMPAAMPIVLNKTAVYRTLNDVTAVDLRTGKLKWRSAPTSDSWFNKVVLKNSESENVANSMPSTLPGFLRFKIFRDQLSGSLSSDGKCVFAIDDTDSQFSPYDPNRQQQRRWNEPFLAAAYNKLQAYELEGGRLLWEIGGQRGSTSPPELSGIYYLGPPLPYENRLLCLAEIKDEIHLLALAYQNDPASNKDSVRLDWSQALIAIHDPESIAPLRRLAGLVPIMANQTIICPTSNGSVVAFDLIKRQLRWGYSYDSRKNIGYPRYETWSQFSNDEETGHWQDTGALIAGGRVVLSPRDSQELHCVDVVDGALIWKRPRETGLYVACVHNDVVVVVGRSRVTAYRLTDGSEVWAQAIDTPDISGRSVRVESKLLLPLTTGEIATLDLSHGRLLGRSRLPDGRIPGNLVVGEDCLVSLGTYDVIGFRSLDEVESQIARQLKTNATDAEALALRGELRLHEGKPDEAITDLRESIRQQPNSRVKRVLAGTLLTELATNLPQLLKSAEELEYLAEEPGQRIEFLRLYIQGLQQAHDHVGAVKQLFRLADLPLMADEPVPIDPGFYIAAVQQVRSQLWSEYDAADARQRPLIAAEFEREYELCLKSDDREPRLVRFAKLVAGHPVAEPVLTRLVKDTGNLADQKLRMRILERLAQSQNKSTAGFAIAILASGLLAENSPRAALPWIEQLARDFSKDICLDGKTGKQLSDEWLVRQDVCQAIVIPYVWPKEASGERGKKRIGQGAPLTEKTIVSGVPVEVVTQSGGAFVGWTFEIDSASTQLIARDASLRVVWQFSSSSFSDLPTGQMQMPIMHIRGRYLAVSSGLWLVVLESKQPQAPPELRFEQSLRSIPTPDRRAQDLTVERRLLPDGRRFQFVSDHRGIGGFLIGLSDEAVFYQMDQRLYAADLDTGRVMWFRSGPEFSRSNATIDTMLTLHTTSNEALLLRPLDGAILQQHKGSLDEKSFWIHGTRRLSQRSEGPDLRSAIEMRDVDGDKVVWQSEHPAGTLKAIIDQERLVLLEPSGKLIVLELKSGQAQMTSQTPVVRPHASEGVLAVQQFEDQLMVIAGVAARSRNGKSVAPLEYSSSISESLFTIDGFVLGINARDGQVNWSVPVEQLAYNSAQSWYLPVLVLAARVQNDGDRPVGALPERKAVALAIDKRTGNQLLSIPPEPLTPTNRGVQFIPQIDEHKLFVDLQFASMEFTFTDAKPADDAKK